MTRQMVNIEAGTSATDGSEDNEYPLNRKRVCEAEGPRHWDSGGIGHYPESRGGRVERVPCNSPVIGIDGRRSVTEAADLMEQYGTRDLAVLKGDSIVGILSVRDLRHPVSIDGFQGFMGNVMREGSRTHGV
jgi:hypothetical protein